MAAYAEQTDGQLVGNQIPRNEPGKGKNSIDLVLDVEGITENYEYSLDVEAQKITKKEADQYFVLAQKEIDDSFYQNHECADHVTTDVIMKQSYADGFVKAEWNLDHYHVIDVDGKIREDLVEPEGTMIQASAELTCGAYKMMYTFPFVIFPKEKTEEEILLAAINESVQQEQNMENKEYLELPEQLNGYQLSWREKKEYLVFKILFLEIVIVTLLVFVKKERERSRRRSIQEEMELDYAEIVNKLLILLGAGMSLKQAWNSISAHYYDKRQKKQTPYRQIYEEMLITGREISDGESERVAYQRFGERTGISAYCRLIRILLQNMQTGSQGLCQMLEQETENALEERKRLARKLGEEAGTKMLVPLIFMLAIVIAIIIVPALLSFST